VPTHHELHRHGGPGPTRVPPELETVFRSNAGALVRALSLLCDDPGDVVQEAFLEAHRHWGAVSCYEDPVGWIRHVATNKARDRLRRQSLERRLLSRLPLPGPRETHQEDRLDLRAAISRLPARQRLAVALFYVGDLSVEEVAVAMSVTTGAVKAALHAGRKRLARMMEVAEDA
jgi:RNA polymerase sigma-70 factor (ECF subfamily)